MQDLASEFSKKNFGPTQREGATPSRTHPSPAYTVLGPKPWSPQLFSRGCVPASNGAVMGWMQLYYPRQMLAILYAKQCILKNIRVIIGHKMGKFAVLSTDVEAFELTFLLDSCYNVGREILITDIIEKLTTCKMLAFIITESVHKFCYFYDRKHYISCPQTNYSCPRPPVSAPM